MIRHFRAATRFDDGSELGVFFDPLELLVRSVCSLVVRELVFIFDVDVLDVDITDVRLDLTGVVGRVEIEFVVVVISFIFELLPLFVDELEVIVVDRFPPCREGDEGIGVLELSSIKCPS